MTDSPTTEAIKELRRSARLTQERAARLIGVTLSTYQRWEGGTYKMDGHKWRFFQEQVKAVKL